MAKATIAVVNKTSVLIDGREYPTGFPVCQGCPFLTIRDLVGWICGYSPDTTDCKYPKGRKAATPVAVAIGSRVKDITTKDFEVTTKDFEETKNDEHDE